VDHDGREPYGKKDQAARSIRKYPVRRSSSHFDAPRITSSSA
jgi:hypothetical protein